MKVKKYNNNNDNTGFVQTQPKLIYLSLRTETSESQLQPSCKVNCD